MKRKYMAQMWTDEELANIKAGKCWCGKIKDQFDKGMRAYCSPKHRSIWYSKVGTWQEFRDAFLRRHGEHCDACGIKQDTYENAERKQIEFLQKLKPQIQDAIIAEKLLRETERYEQYCTKLVDPKNIDDYDVRRYCDKHNITYPKSREVKQIAFEVDHKLAIVNGGIEFDESNLQVLCHDCHVKKTKEDIAFANEDLAQKALEVSP